MLTDRNAILATNDLRRDTVHVEPWNGDVLIQEMTVELQETWQAQWIGAEKTDLGRYVGLRARMVALSVVNERGERLFTDADVEALSRKSPRAIDILFNAAMKLNGLRESDTVEEMEKNSGATPSDSSGSPSPRS